ncbi:MAG: DUF2911 domain-containing protein [Taibaiella sp.]|nr:DUF2911 domain-containing protein [Taibaiella sp.]
MKKNLLVVLSILTLLFTSSVYAQKALPSPREVAKGKVAGATVIIDYGSPSVKGRQIWGGLVPNGEVWRTGANEATVFTTNKEIMVEGKKLAAGSYAFFAIPNEGSWTIIFNKTAKQWGAFKYNSKEDALRVTVKTKHSPAFHERLLYVVNSNGFSLEWENLEVPVMIK